eukprot:TRINITY_DN12309_c0_g1_i3.p1 TRINITY_DN12309_c0_g1~~TRINITY_DN12309_c0_g1_i3.p1  ORF type:complete len:143 (+),score=24.70 TRINITY_DN12309_c0_g1_i3:181-609(+)
MQISALQIAHSATLALLLMLFNSIGGYPMSVEQFSLQFFSPEAFRANSIYSVLTIMAHLLNALVGGWLLTVIVKRAKQCLDFSVTAKLIELLFCCIIQGWPKTWGWWLTCIGSAAIMAVFGEYLCMRIEMQEVPLRQVGDDL